MKRLVLLAAGAALAAVPAIIGLTGNPALSERVPVPVSSGAVPVKAADLEPTDDHGRLGQGADGDASPSATPIRHAEPGDDRGGGLEPGDDRGGELKPGDDRGGAGPDTRRGPGGGRGGDSGKHGGGEDGSGHH